MLRKKAFSLFSSSPRFAFMALGAALAISAVSLTTAPAQADVQVKYSKVKLTKAEKMRFEKKFKRQLAKANRMLKKKAGKGQRPFNLTSVNVVKDCSATVTCGDGTKISCSIQGPGTCESGLHSVACITSNQTETDVCNPPHND